MPKGQYARRKSEPLDRFNDKYQITESECWEWTGARYSNGYGAFYMEAEDGRPRNQLAHRAAWRLLVGPIPDGLVIDHLCRNRACVNPEHTELVTMRTNLLRGEGEPGRHARQTHCGNGHPLSGDNVTFRISRKGEKWRICRECNRAHARKGSRKYRAKKLAERQVV